MKNILHNNIRAFRDQIRAEELNREARIVNQDSFYLDLVTPREEKESLVEPFGFTPFYPGPGLGGHCIPIDPFYLTWKAREFDIATRFIELAGQINTEMPYRVVGVLARTGSVIDRLVLTGIESVWAVHDAHGHAEPRTSPNLTQCSFQ
jgi:hypothetical protein